MYKCTTVAYDDTLLDLYTHTVVYSKTDSYSTVVYPYTYSYTYPYTYPYTYSHMTEVFSCIGTLL